MTIELSTIVAFGSLATATIGFLAIALTVGNRFTKTEEATKTLATRLDKIEKEVDKGQEDLKVLERRTYNQAEVVTRLDQRFDDYSNAQQTRLDDIKSALSSQIASIGAGLDKMSKTVEKVNDRLDLLLHSKTNQDER